MRKRDKNKALRAARKLLAERKHWTKNHYKLFTGEINPVTGKPAKEPAYCLIGAIQEAGGGISTMVAIEEFESILTPCIEEVTGEVWEPISFNDKKETKHKDVLAVLDCAIECTKKGKAK